MPPLYFYSPKMSNTDFSVYNSIINSTNEALNFKSDDAGYGNWVRKTVPSTIAANTRYDGIQIEDSTGLASTEGHLNYFIGSDASISLFGTYVTCPWDSSGNVVKVNLVNPEAVYEITWRAKTGSGDWHNESVDTIGHPIWVEYTVQYQKSKRYRFQVNTITASSGHPVRNSRNELIVGAHTLWDKNTPDVWNDNDKGSFQPNVFLYDSKFIVPSDYFFDVNIKIFDLQLLYSECMLYGTYKGQRIMQSDFFTIKTIEPFPVTVHVIKPETSKFPFVWNAKVEWRMELRLSHVDVDCVEPKTTPLEFYWVYDSKNRAFDNGIPIDFLRNVVPKYAPNAFPLPTVPLNVNPYYQWATSLVFNSFSKIYETCAGGSSFIVDVKGGKFSLAEYLKVDPAVAGGAAGTWKRKVNCADQNGMLQLVCSMGGPTPSWLVQNPFGYIQPTHLVGFGGLSVNNPLFGDVENNACLAKDNPSRQMFKQHVYTGNPQPFQPPADVIYDATCGPHNGMENTTDYLTASIDIATDLYKQTDQRHGTVDDIKPGEGITSIDADHQRPNAVGSLPERDQARLATLLERGKADTPPTSPVSSRHLTTLEPWVRDTLGEVSEVGISMTSVGFASTHSTLHLSAVEQSGTDVRVDAYIEAVATKDRTVDRVASESAARDRLGQIFTTFDRDPIEVFEKGLLTDYGEFCLQYAKDLLAGRIILVSGNVVVDIRGASSSTALEPIARQLIGGLSDVPGGGNDADPLLVPSVDLGASQAFPDVNSDKYEEGTDTLRVVGLDVWCAYRSVVDSPVSTARAEVQSGERGGVLVSKYDVEELEEGCSAVTFEFVARKVGKYDVDLHFAHAKTFVSGTQRIYVEVVDV